MTNVDATAADVLTGKTFVTADGTETAGAMPAIAAADHNVVSTLPPSPLPDGTSSGYLYTIPSGYHNGQGTAYVAIETKSATPSGSSQTITPSSGKLLQSVSVAAIPSKYGDTTGDTAVAGNLLTGVKAHTISNGSAIQITGTMPNNGAVDKTLDATSNNQSYTVPAGYHSGSGQVKISLETKSATPTKTSQDITPTSGKVLSKVTVAAIPSAYQDVTNVDAVAGDVKTGKTFVASDGTEVAGTMPIITAADHNVVVDGEFETDYETVAYY